MKRIIYTFMFICISKSFGQTLYFNSIEYRNHICALDVQTHAELYDNHKCDIYIDFNYAKGLVPLRLFTDIIFKKYYDFFVLKNSKACYKYKLDTPNRGSYHSYRIHLPGQLKVSLKADVGDTIEIHTGYNYINIPLDISHINKKRTF
jgi:hypothetical protein